MEEILGNRPVSSISQALVGNVAGVSLTGNSGEPGSGFTIRIRGNSSINGGSPLILVDNIPMNVSDLNPEDIESVSVLKDASSAAIYGARAAFGVILITTKKSEKDKKNTFNYSSKFSFSKPQVIGKKATPLQNIKAFKDAGVISSWSFDINTYFDLLNEYEQDPSTYPEGFAIRNDVRYPLQNNDLYRDMMDNNGFLQIHDFSVTGGSEKSSYRVSFGATDENGVLHTSKDSYKRYNISSYLSTELSKFLTTEFSFLFSDDKKSDPYDTRFDRNLWEHALSPSFLPVGWTNYNGELRPFNTPRNTLELTEPDISGSNRINILGRATFTPVKDLKIIGEYSVNRTKNGVTSFDKVFRQFIDGYTYSPRYSSNTQSVYRETQSSTINNVINIYGNYAKKVNNHNFSTMVGVNAEQYSYESLYAQRLDMINQELPSIGQGVGLITADDDFLEYALFGAFYRFNYSFKERYLVEASGRYDGSSKFPESNRFGFFPSFSAGWRISEEPFMNKIRSVFQNIKLRASWGSIGNQDIAPYTYLSSMTSSLVNWVDGGQKVISLNTPGLVRSNFTWEQVRTINGGIDIGVFNNRLSSSFDIFSRETIGMLGPGADYPSVIGANAPLQNSANMLTNGWEFQMSWRDKVGDWSYNVGFNLSDNISKITKFKNDTKILTDHYEGKVMGEIWGYETDRFYTVDDFEEGTLKTTAQGVLTGGTLKPGIPKIRGSFPNPGDILYKNPDADGNIWSSANTVNDPGSKRIIGNSSYRFVFGFDADVSYKGFGLSVLLQGVGKRDVWMRNSYLFPFSQDWYFGMFDYQLDYWTPDNTDAYYARLYPSAGYNTNNNLSVQSKYLLNAAYLDVKSVVFSYEIPKSIMQKINLDKATLFINGENLYSFNKFPKGIHPDSKDRGQGITYPVMRMFTIGANITF